MRVTERGLEYEADPRHVDLIAESLELTNAKSAANPGIKNPDASTECESKEIEPQCDRSAIIDPGLSPDSSVSSSATMQGGTSTGLEPKSDDTIASLVGDNSDADTVGTDHNNDAETVGTYDSNDGPENVLELLCTLISDNALFGAQPGTAVRHVKFNDALNTCHDITPL